MALTAQLNKKYGRDPDLLPAHGAPLTDVEFADLRALQLQQELKYKRELLNATRFQAWRFSASARSIASKDAYELAKETRPDNCQRCGLQTRLYGHHVTPYAQLKREGREHDMSAHVYEWICRDCHAAEHPELSALIKATSDGRMI